MEKQMKVDPKGHSLLTADEMRHISGGSLTETIIKVVMSGMNFFYRMGVSEAKRMKTLV